MRKDPDLKVVTPTKSTVDTTETDGRRQRSERSRKLIIDAMLDLLRDGEVRPGAARVAEVAGVGLRTVFRLFDDMDSLYRELMKEAEHEFLPGFMSPLTAEDWRAQLDQLISRRATMYERIMPLKVAAGIRRFQSDFLMDSHKRFRSLERSGLVGVLPTDLAANNTLFAALETALCFDAWRAMRQDQELTPEESEAVMLRTAAALLDHSTSGF
ncbi:MAG: TetR/AcrR family transcriptional regulator [Pseudomonadota bacterium]